MNYKALVINCLAMAAFAVGCKPSDDKSAADQLKDVKTETKAAAREMKDYTYAQKAEFVANMQDQVNALNKDLDRLSAKLDSSSDAVKADAKPKLQALRDQVNKLNRQLDEARNASESTWDGVKADSRQALDSVKDAFQQSRQWLSDKIAP
jgi:uncharacterized protein YoxC